MDDALAYAQRGRRRFVRELQSFVRFPSVSSQPLHAADLRRCAAWLGAHLRQIGMVGVSIIATRRHPFVVAESPPVPGRPVVLVYGHYDVQPVAPLAQWKVPPFEPTEKSGYLLGRGASDDKGQLFTHVKALEAFIRTRGRPPVNVRCLFDGEEEIGSPSLPGFLRSHRSRLRADVAVVSDTRILGPDRPAITHGLRGGLRAELEVRGPNTDLHSGHFGGMVHNPLQALCELIARLHLPDGRVAIPGFYDLVRTSTAAARQEMARAGPSDHRLLKDAGVSRPWGERDYSLYERTTIRPALTVNGITGGHQGPGGKGIIPASALAKISFRLVPDQQPAAIARLLLEYLQRIAPPTVRCTLRMDAPAAPVLQDRQHWTMDAASNAYARAFGSSPVFLRSGGSIPLVNTLTETLNVPTVLMGFALPDDNPHAPNEQMHLATFQRGVETSIWFMHEVAQRSAALPSNRSS